MNNIVLDYNAKCEVNSHDSILTYINDGLIRGWMNEWEKTSLSHKTPHNYVDYLTPKRGNSIPSSPAPWMWAVLSDSLPSRIQKVRRKKQESSGQTWQTLPPVTRVRVNSDTLHCYHVPLMWGWWEGHFTPVVLLPKTMTPAYIVVI